MRVRLTTRTAWAWAACAMLGAAMAGCLHVPPANPVEWPPAADHGLIILPGDQLMVRFAYTPELNDTQAVRPDGKISLQLVGEIDAGGKAPSQLRDELIAAYNAQVKDPKIDVVVKGLEGNRVYVGGEVAKPGTVILDGPTTASQAIVASGGFNKLGAKTNRVVVLRQRGDKQFGRTVDVRGEMESPSTKPFFLEPYDIVYVPTSRIDRADQWVEQYINRLLPNKVNYGLNYTWFRQINNQSNNQPAINVTP